MKTIYIVYSYDTMPYSDTQNWDIKAFSNKTKAEQFCKELRAGYAEPCYQCMDEGNSDYKISTEACDRCEGSGLEPPWIDYDIRELELEE